MRNLFNYRNVTIASLAIILVGIPYLVLQHVGFKSEAAGATVTVSNTITGTIQTQLSTNIVTWASDFTQFPNGQTNLNALNAPYIRLHVGDDDTVMPEQTQGSWNMSGLNTMVSDVFNAGQQPLMNIKYAPDWQWTCYPNTQKGATGTVRDTTYQEFAQYMVRLLNYYNKGSMTTESGTVLTNPAGTTHKITYWELWNEPDLNNETPCAPSSGNGLTPAQYLTMWNAVTQAMLAVDPTIKFVGPATAGTQFGSSTATGNQYIDNIMGSGTTIKPSAISIHGYGDWQQDPDTCFFDGIATGCGGIDSGKGIAPIVQGVQTIHSKYPTIPIWMTEVNVNADWSAAGQNDNELSVAWWATLMQQLAPFGVGIIHQYEYTGSNLFGLVDGEGIGNNQPAGGKMLPYYLVQLLDSAFPQGSIILSSSSVQSGILSLAVKKPDNTVSVMIINRTVPSNTATTTCGNGGSSQTVTVDLSALNPTSIQLTQLDKRNINCSTWLGIAPTTQTVAVANPMSVTIPGYGVAIFNIATNGQIFPTATPAPPTPTPAPGTSQISGVIYVDTNGNNTKDTGEPNYTSSVGGYAGAVTVNLSGAATSTTTSDATGKYVFTNLSDGTYTIAVTAPPGWTADPTKNRTISGANVTANMGIIPPQATPTPVVGNGDVNNDGKVDSLDGKGVLSAWFQSASGIGGANQYGDTYINSMDFGVVINNLPSPTPTSATNPTATPTPTAGISTPTPTLGGTTTFSALHVSGNQILNAQNQVVHLHGVNHSGLEYACIQGWGFFDTPDGNPPSIAAMKAWHINAVNLGINEDCWLGINGVSTTYGGTNYQNTVQNFVNQLLANGIYPMISMFWTAPGTQQALGLATMADADHTPAAWSGIANKFKGDDRIMFRLLEEPHPANGNTTNGWNCWLNGGANGQNGCNEGFTAAGMQSLLTAVRNTGATNIVWISGVDYGASFDQFLTHKPTDPLNNIGGSTDVYAGGKTASDTSACHDLTCYNTFYKPVLNQIPFMSGEFGESVNGDVCATTKTDEFLNWMDTNGASGYFAWTWNTWGTTCGDLSLITDFSGTAHSPNGTYYKNRLLSKFP